ncbi:YqiA/YcfP family alpha/beta fold hydrolase [Floricoccus penangensis]|uniref:YqiA/YcfP family alpha/beta fold hydrolase n=1 Tax=Floricoccus penangensis TaxID=1859475 RepID=UPI0020414631|nr:YqiA/YcfP family alpha/beta fold hydrolase [Floricoccus penangensis]URZ87360.1 hypothetical protein KIW23_09880 [Floricoccus penangensis]
MRKQSKTNIIAAGTTLVASGLVFAYLNYLESKKRIDKRAKRNFKKYIFTNFPQVNDIEFGEFKSSSVVGYQHINTHLDGYQLINLSSRDIEEKDFSIRWMKNEFPDLNLSFKENSKITDRDYNVLSDMVYYADGKKAIKDGIPKVDVGDVILTSAQYQSEPFEVVLAEDNQENGMQVIACKRNNDIVISYAGTNIDDNLDVIADARTIIFDEKIPDETKDSQWFTAKKFYEQVVEKFPDMEISLTGHSLGGYLALAIGATYERPATVFNAPDPSRIISDEARSWMKENSKFLKNYRNNLDLIGNFGGDKCDVGVVIDKNSGADPAVNHGISTWNFDQQGNVKK